MMLNDKQNYSIDRKNALKSLDPLLRLNAFEILNMFDVWGSCVVD